jgi:hypothetical protein
MKFKPLNIKGHASVEHTGHVPTKKEVTQQVKTAAQTVFENRAQRFQDALHEALKMENSERKNTEFKQTETDTGIKIAIAPEAAKSFAKVEFGDDQTIARPIWRRMIQQEKNRAGSIASEIKVNFSKQRNDV